MRAADPRSGARSRRIRSDIECAGQAGRQALTAWQTPTTHAIQTIIKNENGRVYPVVQASGSELRQGKTKDRQCGAVRHLRLFIATVSASCTVKRTLRAAGGLNWRLQWHENIAQLRLGTFGQLCEISQRHLA